VRRLQRTVKQFLWKAIYGMGRLRRRNIMMYRLGLNEGYKLLPTSYHSIVVFREFAKSLCELLSRQGKMPECEALG
jgi:hypothetical protein